MDTDKKRKPFKKLRVLKKILNNTGADRIFMSFVAFVFADALVIFLADPAIESYGDALWYCYSVISTAGFGDVVATTLVTKICSLLLTLYATLVIAIVTGVVVNYYNELILEKNKEGADGNK